MTLKLFAKNTFIYSIGNIAIRVSTFLLIPLYTHYLSVSEYGLLSTMLLTTQIIIMVVDFGIMPSLIRFSNEYGRENRSGLLVGSSIIVNLIAGFVVSLISLYLLTVIFEVTLEQPIGTKYALLTIGSAIFQCYSINLLSYFRAVNKAKFFIFSSISLTILYLLLTVLFLVILRLGIEGIFLAQVISYGLFWIFLLIMTFREIKFSFSYSTIMNLIKFGFPLIFARGGDLILDTAMLFFIGFFASLTEVGIYSLATKISSILLVLLITPFQLSYEPYIYSQLEERELPNRISKIFTYLTFIFVFFSISLLAGFKFLITIIAPKDYFGSYFLIFFIIPIYFFRGINSISQTLIHIKNKTNITGTIVTIVTVVGLIVSYFLIKEYGTNAAIFTSNLYWFSIAFILFFFGQKLYPISLELKKLVILFSIYIFFNIVIYSLAEINNVLFYFIFIFLLGLTFLSLYKSNFIDKNERDILLNYFNKLINFVKLKSA